MIKTFHKYFEHNEKCGNEYFSGRLSRMIKCIKYVVKELGQEKESDTEHEQNLRNEYKSHLRFRTNEINDITGDMIPNDVRVILNSGYQSEIKKTSMINHTSLKCNKKTFSCSKCNKTFTTKQSLQYHKDNNSCKKTVHACKYCKRSYTTATSMYRHMRTSCNAKQQFEREKDEIYERLLKLEQENAEVRAANKKYANEIEQLKNDVNRKNSSIKNKTSNINNGVQVTNGNVNINNGTINHITLIAHGKEDISKIDRSELIKVFGSGFNSTLKLTETMHFNPKYPEFHNVYISSMKNKYAMVYDGNDWNLVMKDDLIDRMYDNKRDRIEENLDDFVKSLTGSQKRALHRWMNADDTHPYISKIKNDIKLLLYNKRNMPLTYKSSGVITTISDITHKEGTKDTNRNVRVIKEAKHTSEQDDKTDNQRSVRVKSPFARTAGRPGTKRKIIVRKN